ncbi:MAG: ATP-binding protein [Rubrivivax sp.]
MNASPVASLAALIEAAWAAQFEAPERIRALADEVLARAPEGSIDAGWGWVHRAWAARFARQPEEAAEALARARQCFAAHGDARGQASVADLERRDRTARGEPLEVEPEAEAAADDESTMARGPWERLVAHYGHFGAADRGGRPEAALRALYRALAAARDTGHAAAQANTLAMLGAKHADVGDLEPAARWCSEALEHSASTRPAPTWQIAALNRLFVAIERAEADVAQTLADAIEGHLPQVLPHAQEQAHLLVARARRLAGDAAGAQQALAQGRALPGPRLHGGEWVATEAELQLAQGDAAAAWQTVQGWLATGGPEAPFSTPNHLLRVHRVAAAAAEQRGHWVEALHHLRAAHAVAEQQMGRAAAVRRVALGVQHDLDRERWQRERAEAERKRLDGLNRALQGANAAKTHFLAAASHDLRQPVQALALNMAALDIEARQNAAPTQQALVARMGASLQALTQMFDVLLDISRLDAGLVPVQPEPVALVPLLQRLHDELAPTAAARGLKWRWRMAAGAQAAGTRTDPVLLERCLRNLLDNALKYTERGGVLLALRRRAGGWVVQVADTGVGMGPEELSRACEEFYQANNPERDRRRGLGLGLAIVQRLLGLMGHGLALRSRPARGTLASLSVTADALPAAAEGPAERTGAAGQPGWVAVIDDDTDVRQGLHALLSRWGHPVLMAADDTRLLQAWRDAGRPPVQAIVCDLRLAAHRSGLQAVAALRSAWRRDVPALVITGDIAPDRMAPLAASGLPWLAKPVMPMRLRGWLASLAG